MNSTIPTCALNLARNCAKRNVQICQVRFKKIQTRNPPEPHYDRKAMLEACKPIIPRREPVCAVINYVPPVIEPHPWNVIKAQKLRQKLEEARMILFFQKNPIAQDKDFEAKNKLFKKDIFVQPYGNRVSLMATKDGFLANASPLLISQTVLAVSPHQDIKTCLRVLKKIPQYVLLAGVVDRTFLSRQQLEWLATVPSIQSLQSITVGLLSTHQQRLYGNLNQHQQRLSMLLSQHSKNTAAPAASAGEECSSNVDGAVEGKSPAGEN